MLGRYWPTRKVALPHKGKGRVEQEFVCFSHCNVNVMLIVIFPQFFDLYNINAHWIWICLIIMHCYQLSSWQIAQSASYYVLVCLWSIAPAPCPSHVWETQHVQPVNCFRNVLDSAYEMDLTPPKTFGLPAPSVFSDAYLHLPLSSSSQKVRTLIANYIWFSVI